MPPGIRYGPWNQIPVKPTTTSVPTQRAEEGGRMNVTIADYLPNDKNAGYRSWTWHAYRVLTPLLNIINMVKAVFDNVYHLGSSVLYD